MRVALVSMETAAHRETLDGRRADRTARALAARGHDVTVCCAKWWDGSASAFERDGVPHRAVTERSSPRAFAAKLPLALRALDPDAIHALARPPSAVRAAAAAGRLLRTPVVLDWWTDPGPGAARAVGAADLVIAPSEAGRTRARGRGADPDDVRVIPEGIDLAAVREAPVDERADVVFARRLDGRANVETFLLALAELRGRTWRAAVIGDGPGRADAERTARDLRIADRVEFTGALSARERTSVLKGAHAFVQTAEREPFATELLRALACGCHGIVEYQLESSAHELVEGRERGHLVTGPGELAEAIAATAGADRRTSAAGFDDYDRAATLDRYEDCYREAIDGKRWF